MQVSAYAGMKRTNINHAPTLKCTNKNDRFTVSSSLGNGVLTYPVGLVTSDEVVMAGGNGADYATWSGIFNEKYYLFVPDAYWTMTPFSFLNDRATVDFVIGGIVEVAEFIQYSGIGIRPVISLKSDAITSGSGTSNDPFIVSEAPDSEYVPVGPEES